MLASAATPVMGLLQHLHESLRQETSVPQGEAAAPGCQRQSVQQRLGAEWAPGHTGRAPSSLGGGTCSVGRHGVSCAGCGCAQGPRLQRGHNHP